MDWSIRLSREDGKWPSVARIAVAMGYDDETVKQRMKRAKPPIRVPEVHRKAQQRLAEVTARGSD